MWDIIRDAPVGQLARWISGNRIASYPEHAPDFDLDQYVKTSPGPPSPTDETAAGDPEKAVKRQTVEWSGPEDGDNPQNWSLPKKCFVLGELCLLTFAIYSGSSIVVPASPTFISTFGLSGQESSLTLSIYVLGYGTGPLFFSPLSEVPRVGRNLPYMSSLFLFVILSIPTARVSNFPGLVVLRFLQGFCGGPVLATGGASIADMFAFWKLSYAMSIWVLAAYGGPALGPLISAWAIKRTWRWSIYEMLIIGGFAFTVMALFLPETNAETILLRRAQRLRRRTGRSDLTSQSEQKQTTQNLLKLMGIYLTTPIKVMVQDPSIAFVNIYTALVYGIYYSFFESFPVAYQGVYGFTIQSMSIVFVTLLISCLIGVVIYFLLVWYIYEPYTMANGIGKPEKRLEPGVWASAILPIGLFIFGWCAREGIHWAVPTIGLLIFPACAFILIQVILLYLPTSYPRYAASLFAANTFLRSALACAAIHFSRPLFENLGVAKGNSVLGGLTVGCCLCFIGLWYYGDKLRAKSKFAESY